MYLLVLSEKKQKLQKNSKKPKQKLLDIESEGRLQSVSKSLR